MNLSSKKITDDIPRYRRVMEKMAVITSLRLNQQSLGLSLYHCGMRIYRSSLIEIRGKGGGVRVRRHENAEKV